VSTQVPPVPDGIRDFDFLTGDWRVHHHRLRPGTDEWVDFEGTATNHPMMDGSANIEEHRLDPPGGAYQAIALRAYDPASRQWAIWWLDDRYPGGPVGPAVKGRFTDGLGSFYADYLDDGVPMRVRFRWSDITATSARWEQSVSADGGETWAPNWVMNFHRADLPPTPTATDAFDSDFAVLQGDWRVRHRFLRIQADRREWLDVSGTVRHRMLTDGRANVEEHLINAPSGPYHAVALRSYDPKSSEWSVWWLDSRSPHDDLDPPVRGRFTDGTATFYGDTTVDERPARLRFVWADITATAARWEQSLSRDAGASWERNWIMDYQRAD
jgi:hypothetical protein